MTYDLTKFTGALPVYARSAAPHILANEDEHVSAFTIFGIGDRETRWGTHSTYKQHTGDWTPRLWSHERIGRFPHVNVVGQKEGKFLVMPADGLGWGRGLMQLDLVAEYSWLIRHDWRDPATNIARGVAHLRTKFAFFLEPAGADVVVDEHFARRYSTEELVLTPGTYKDTRPFEGGALETAAIAAYNATKENVLAAVLAGGIAAADLVTTEKNYSKDVRRRALTMRLRYEGA